MTVDAHYEKVRVDNSVRDVSVELSEAERLLKLIVEDYEKVSPKLAEYLTAHNQKNSLKY